MMNNRRNNVIAHTEIVAIILKGYFLNFIILYKVVVIVLPKDHNDFSIHAQI